MPIKTTCGKGGCVNTVHSKPLSKHPLPKSTAIKQKFAVNVSEGKIPGVKTKGKK